MTTTLSVEPLSETVGVRVSGVDRDRMAHDAALGPAVAGALAEHGVLLFPDLHLDPETQVAFCRTLGELDLTAAHDPIPGVMRVTLDRAKNPDAPYLKGTFFWHIDGCTPDGDECPQMATVLSAVGVADAGGETEFASTYAAHDSLTDDEKERFARLQVVHTLEASQSKAFPDAPDRLVAAWRTRAPKVHPLVWTHRDGRRSLVVGVSADHVVGMDPDESRALLDDLLDRATRPEAVYRHEWSVGDTVIWDNRGLVHRATPYEASSSREMLRTVILGDEPIR